MPRPLHNVASAIALVVTVAAAARAQSSVPKNPGFELLVPTGTVVPRGAQQDDVKRGNLTAVQASYGIRPDLALTGTFGWARTRPLHMGSDVKLDMLTYDVGVEYRMPRRSADGPVNFKPFAGLGAGARAYNYRNVDAATTHHLAAYVGAGGELGLGRVRVRLEVRDYVSGQNVVLSSDARSRNDVAVMAGLRLALR